MKRVNLFLLNFSLFLLLIVGNSQAETSKLWGTAGEKWISTGRLADFSQAGYHAGEKAIPNLPVSKNAKTDYGLTGNGSTDETSNLNTAINGTNGVLLLPKGRYRLSNRIMIKKSNFVLRGEGSGADGTVLYFTKSLGAVLGGGSWQFGEGGMLWVGNGSDRGLGSKITNITSNTTRGNYTILVSSGSGISSGQLVIIRMNDSSDKSLFNHMHNNQNVSTDYPFNKPSANVLLPMVVKSVSGNSVTFKTPLKLDTRTKWGAALYRYSPSVQEVGIENLRIEFADTRYTGHHTEKGKNGLAFFSAKNCWARNIVIKNAENGMDFDKGAAYNTVTDFVLMGASQYSTAPVDKGKFGHHGVNFLSDAANNMLNDFHILDRYIHDISVEGRVNGNVIRNGVGFNISFDHHKYIPFENLFSNVNVGIGTATYIGSGSAENGAHSAARDLSFTLSLVLLFNIKDTKGWDTPASLAMSFMVTPLIFFSFDLINTY